MKKLRRLILSLICLLFVTVFIYSGLRLYEIMHGYREAEKRYDELSGAVAAPGTASGPEQGGDPAAANAPDSGGGSDGPEEGMKIDFDKLKDISDYVVGWLYLPDSVINYPVAQYSDNEFFLDRFIDGSFQSGGTLFVDCVCPPEFSGQNTVIYGHHMKDGSMFASLEKYAEQDYYDTHAIMYLYTPEQDYEIHVFSAFTTSATSYVYATFFPYSYSFQDHINALRYMSDISSEVEVTADDRLITMSTCAYSFEDARYVVVGKLVPVKSAEQPHP